MFRMYRQYQTINAVIELYVNFEEVVAQAGHSLYLTNPHYNEFILNSYPMSIIIFCFANFCFKINMYLFYHNYYYYYHHHHHYYYYMRYKVCSTLASC